MNYVVKDCEGIAYHMGDYFKSRQEAKILRDKLNQEKSAYAPFVVSRSPMHPNGESFPQI